MNRTRTDDRAGSPGPSLSPRQGLARAAPGLALLSALIALAWLAWLGAGTRDELRVASQKAVRVAELRGTIAYLDEWLTMSARMAVASGEARWAERYDEAAPKLDAAIAEAAAIATPEVRAALARTTGEAHRDLVTMERRSFALVARDDLAGARDLLNGPEFTYLEDVYASGIEVFGQDLGTLADARAADTRDRAWLEAGALGLMAILLVATALTVAGHLRLRRAMAHTDAVARTDMLTDLPNRRQFYDDLDEALSDLRPDGDRHALMLIDLDRFKAANDAHGHPSGDELLRRVASRLRGLIRTGDLIARLGGDEFGVLIRIGSAAQVSSEAAQVATRLVNALGEPFRLDDGTAIQIGGSVGVALTQSSGQNAGELLRQGDVALYRAKSDGRGCFRFFEQGMDAQVLDRALLRGELRQAVAEQAIVPYFQPLVAMDTGRLIGVEMLARWPHPTRGMVSPADFIPIAEDTGLIGALTESLLRQGCAAAAGWPSHVTLACNVSPLQLRDRTLPTMIRTVLQETGFPASRLEVEVTESALVGDVAFARTLLEQLKALGVRLALDDFGTGYSSLRHLQLLPFDKLKIDASFVGAMTSDGESAKIVSAVVGLGHSLGLSIVAEGVETEEVAALLRDLGCDIGQGWLYGRPAAAGRIDELTGIVRVARPSAPAIAA